MSVETAIDLYRIENPNIPAEPDGITSHEELVGNWFAPDLSDTMSYLRKSTQSFGPNSRTIDGAQLVIAEVPEQELPLLHVSRHPIASRMDVEGNNYLLQREEYPHLHIPLDPIIGDLRGKLGNYNNLREARERIEQHLAATAILKGQI